MHNYNTLTQVTIKCKKIKKKTKYLILSNSHSFELKYTQKKET